MEEKVKQLLREVLGLDEEEPIALDSGLIDDLGAESIDFIDICYRVEKDFGLTKVNPSDVFPAFLQEEDLVDDSGSISGEAMEQVVERLSKEYPHMNGKIMGELIKTGNARAVLTVRNLVEYVSYHSITAFEPIGQT